MFRRGGGGRGAGARGGLEVVVVVVVAGADSTEQSRKAAVAEERWAAGRYFYIQVNDQNAPDFLNTQNVPASRACSVAAVREWWKPDLESSGGCFRNCTFSTDIAERTGRINMAILFQNNE